MHTHTTAGVDLVAWVNTWSVASKEVINLIKHKEKIYQIGYVRAKTKAKFKGQGLKILCREGGLGHETPSGAALSIITVL